jgi:hypothetical protein
MAINGVELDDSNCYNASATDDSKNPWIAEQLNMGHPSRITNLIRESRE